MTHSKELNKERFFERTIAEMNCDIEAGEIETESGHEVTVPPLHRDIYTPLVWIPELEDDSEMTDYTSDEELDRELSEEEELDRLDMDAEMDHELGLWDKAQRFETSGLSVEVPSTRMGQRTMYKSAEFIEDSD